MAIIYQFKNESHNSSNEAKQFKSVVWVRLPKLPTEYYDSIILQKIGSTIGRLLRIDACTSSTLRERYARLCVEVSMNKPVKSFVYIKNYKHHIYYEGENFLWTKCGKLGHSQSKCLMLSTPPKICNQQGGLANIPKQDSQNDWVTVTFNNKKKSIGAR